MTDFRALCAELAEFVARLTKHYYKPAELLTRARAALAEPEPERPTDEDLLDLHDWMTDEWAANHDFELPPSQYAHAVLACWGNCQGSLDSSPPANSEVAELVEWLREQLHVCLQAPWTPGIKHFGRAANLLERLSPPVPVPVNERLPGPKDCDAEGRCWWWQPSHPEGDYLEGWMLRPRFWGVGHYDLDDRLTHTHWLPAHALPLPTAND